jgi:hypothetical protein
MPKIANRIPIAPSTYISPVRRPGWNWTLADNRDPLPALKTILIMQRLIYSRHHDARKHTSHLSYSREIDVLLAISSGLLRVVSITLVLVNYI